MSDAANLYERHDDLNERVATMRKTLADTCDEFGDDPEAEAIERRLNATGQQLGLLNDRIEELEQVEVDQQNGEPISEHENTEVRIAEIEKSIPPIDEEIADAELELARWRSEVSRGEDDDDDGDDDLA